MHLHLRRVSTRALALCVLTVAITSTACGSDSETADTQTADTHAADTNTGETHTTEVTQGDVDPADLPGDAVDPGGVTSVVVHVTDPLGDVLAGVDVAIDGRVVTTGADGSATFDPPPSPATFVVAARADGLADAFAVVTPTGTGAYELALAMPATVSTVVEPDEGATVVSVGALEVTLPPAGAFVDPGGAAYEGSVELRYADLSETVAFTTPLPLPEGADPDATSAVVGSLELSLYGAAGGDAVALQPSSAVGLRIPIEVPAEIGALLEGDDVFLALARFDTESGAWVFEGELAYAEGIASVTVTHFTRFISYVASRFAGRPPIAIAADFDTGCACGRVVRGGAPVAGARVTYSFSTRGHGVTVSGSAEVTTPSDGRFCHRTRRQGATATISQIGPPAVTIAGAFPVNDGYEIDGQAVRVDARPTMDGDPTMPATCRDLGDVAHPVAGPRPTCATNADCNDGNACTDDVCDATLTACPGGTACSGCASTVRTGSCDDGNLCTTGETCSTGTPTTANPTGAVCGSGAAVTCTASADPCLEGVCSPLTGCSDLPVCRHDPNSVCDAGTCVCNSWSQPTVPPGGTTAVCDVSASLGATCQAIGGLACADYTTGSCLATLGEQRTGTGALCTTQFDAVLACLRTNLATAVGCTTREPQGWELAFPSPCQAELDTWEACKAAPPTGCTVEVRATTGAIAGVAPIQALCVAGRSNGRLLGFFARDDGEAPDYMYGGSPEDASTWAAFDAAGGEVLVGSLFAEIAPGPGAPGAVGQGVTVGDGQFLAGAGLGVWQIPAGSTWRLLEFDDAADTFRLQLETVTLSGTVTWPPVGDASGNVVFGETGTATIVMSGRFSDFN